MTDLYTVELTLTDGTVVTATELSAANAQGCVSTFINQTGECGFVRPDGAYVWPWYAITSCKVTRQP